MSKQTLAQLYATIHAALVGRTPGTLIQPAAHENAEKKIADYATLAGTPYNGNKYKEFGEAIRFFAATDIQIGRLYYILNLVSGYHTTTYRYMVEINYCQGSMVNQGVGMRYQVDAVALKTGVEMIPLNEVDGSGMVGYMVIDWDKLIDRTSQGYECQTYAEGALFAMASINNTGGGVGGGGMGITPIIIPEETDDFTADGSKKIYLFNGESGKTATVDSMENIVGEVFIQSISAEDLIIVQKDGLLINGAASVLLRAGGWIKIIANKTKIEAHGVGYDPLVVGDLPSPEAKLRGKTLTLDNGTGVADSFYICIKNDSDGYEWKEIQFVNL